MRAAFTTRQAVSANASSVNFTRSHPPGSFPLRMRCSGAAGALRIRLAAWDAVEGHVCPL